MFQWTGSGGIFSDHHLFLTFTVPALLCDKCMCSYSLAYDWVRTPEGWGQAVLPHSYSILSFKKIFRTAESKWGSGSDLRRQEINSAQNYTAYNVWISLVYWIEETKGKNIFLRKSRQIETCRIFEDTVGFFSVSAFFFWMW